jgi:hypothetical protein
VGDGNFYPSLQEMEAILAGIAASTSLTKLHLAAYQVTQEVDQPVAGNAVPVAACSRLTGLSRLRDLAIHCEWDDGPWLEKGDALALTALTGLTSLSLTSHGAALGDLEANALACNLTQLRYLNLSDNDLGSMVCLAAIARLTQLTGLVLYDAYGQMALTQRGLIMLIMLSRLQELDLLCNDEVTEQVLERFWAAVRAQQQQQQQQQPQPQQAVG